MKVTGGEIWINAFRNNTQTREFPSYRSVTETINLGAVARARRCRVEYDTSGMKITNVADANKFLTREYRQGWEL